jgi:hypothetical protein
MKNKCYIYNFYFHKYVWLNLHGHSNIEMIWAAFEFLTYKIFTVC